jgi:nicotinamidase/pyrazinamidase
MYSIAPNDALIVVDPQNDFLPGGSLAVADGWRIFDPINRIMRQFKHVLATRDWHPPDHDFFEHRGGPWPLHCLADTSGAAFSDRFHVEHVHEIVSKGTDSQTDGYSGFAGTDLAQRLRSRGVTRIFVCGLATDYCVKATAIEAVEQGFDTIVLTDAIAAVNLQPGDEEKAMRAMEERGVKLATTDELAIARFA